MKTPTNAATKIVDEIVTNNAEWSNLFIAHDFFNRYRYYLQVIASSDSAELQLMWAGKVESRIRHLIMKLEVVPNLFLAHPFIKGFNKVHQCATDQEVVDVTHGVYNPDTTVQSEGTDENYKEGSAEGNTPRVVKKTVHLTTFYIGLLIKPKDGKHWIGCFREMYKLILYISYD